MAICSMRSLLYLHSFANISNPPGSPFLVPAKFSSKPSPPTQRISTLCRRTAGRQDPSVLPDDHTELDLDLSRPFQSEISKLLVVGAVSFGVAFYLMVWDGERALALGPEGPLMEEFWENIRRYALYALTVSTGAIYTIFQPILELLKNPISAILVLAILGGGIYVVSQVVYAMVGVSNFTYDYGY